MAMATWTSRTTRCCNWDSPNRHATNEELAVNPSTQIRRCVAAPSVRLSLRVTLMSAMLLAGASSANAQILSAKRGFADTGASYTYLQAVNAGWYHRWGPSKSSGASGFDCSFVPMFWGGYQVTQSNIDMIIGYGDIEWVLGFNEPERSTQANMTVSAAIAAWQTLEDGFAGTGIKLISPSVSDDSTGQSWLSSFMSQANSLGLQVDAVSFHWYGISNPNDPVGAANSFLGRVDSYHNSYGRPVWITEFALHDWSGNYTDEEMRAANATFLRTAIPGLESRSYVAGYAFYPWFGDSKLVEGDPLTPTNVGVEYIGVLESGDYYDFSGVNLGEHVAYLGGGELAHNSAAGVLHYINALSGSSVISGSVDWDLTSGNWVRVQPEATLRKRGPNQLTWTDTTVTNQGTIEIADGTVLVSGNPTLTATGTLRIQPHGTVAYTNMRNLKLDSAIELNGGTLSTDVVSGFNLTTGATLVGQGAIVGGLTAQTDALVQVGPAGLPRLATQYVFDDFESYALGYVRTVASPPWIAHGGGSGTMFAAIENDSGNNVFSFGWTDDFRGASRPLPGGLEINDGDVATLFCRFKSLTDSPNHALGLGDQATTDGVYYTDYEAQIRLYPDSISTSGTYGLDGRSGNAFVDLVDGLSINVWYNVWLVVDQATDTYDVYLNTGPADATAANKLNATPLTFRYGTTDPLNTFLTLAGSAPVDFGARLDDLTLLQGVDLTNPLGGMTPTYFYAPATLAVNGNFTLNSGAVIELGIGGATACDNVAATGAVTVGGTLRLVVDSTAADLPAGAAFDLFDAASISGAFESIDAPTLATGQLWDMRALYTLGVAAVTDARGLLDGAADCFSGPDVAYSGDCAAEDADADGDVDLLDFARLQACVPGSSGMLFADCLTD